MKCKMHGLDNLKTKFSEIISEEMPYKMACTQLEKTMESDFGTYTSTWKSSMESSIYFCNSQCLTENAWDVFLLQSIRRCKSPSACTSICNLKNIWQRARGISENNSGRGFCNMILAAECNLQPLLIITEWRFIWQIQWTWCITANAKGLKNQTTFSKRKLFWTTDTVFIVVYLLKAHMPRLPKCQQEPENRIQRELDGELEHHTHRWQAVIILCWGKCTLNMFRACLCTLLCYMYPESCCCFVLWLCWKPNKWILSEAGVFIWDIYMG